MSPEEEPAPVNEYDARYRFWRATHPECFALFLRFAQQLCDKGRRFGTRLIIERVRWEVHMHIEKDAEGYRLNDHLTPYLARDLIRHMPALADLIETRVLGSERHPARPLDADDPHPMP